MMNVTHQCGRCDQVVDFSFVVAFEHTQRTPDEVRERSDALSSSSQLRRIDHNERRGKALGSAQAPCPRCNGPSMFVFEANAAHMANILTSANPKEPALLGGSSLINVLEIYPPVRVPHTDKTWPNDVAELFESVQSAHSQKLAPAMVLPSCRTVLELALKSLDETGQNDKLYARIKRLRESGVITQGITDWAHSIRLDGNSAVHEGVADGVVVTEYIEFLRLFLDVVFALPERIKARQSS